MSKRQEIQHTVVLSHWHTLVISHHGGVVLATGKDDALRVARRTTGIEDVRYIIHRGGSREGIHLRLARQILTQLQRTPLSKMMMRSIVLQVENTRRALSYCSCSPTNRKRTFASFTMNWICCSELVA